MLPDVENLTVKVSRISEEEFIKTTEVAVSYVGHADTAKMLGVECNRGNVELDKNTMIYVAQFCGGRLPEGTTTLPANYPMKYFKVWLD